MQGRAAIRDAQGFAVGAATVKDAARLRRGGPDDRLDCRSARGAGHFRALPADRYHQSTGERKAGGAVPGVVNRGRGHRDRVHRDAAARGFPPPLQNGWKSRVGAQRPTHSMENTRPFRRRARSDPRPTDPSQNLQPIQAGLPVAEEGPDPLESVHARGKPAARRYCHLEIRNDVRHGVHRMMLMPDRRAH